MDEIIELVKRGWVQPLPQTKRRVQTKAGTVITYVTGSAHRRYSGRASVGTLEDKFFVRVKKTPTCWLWTGSTDPDGYGRFFLGQGKTVFAHRWSYEHFVGPIPQGYVVDHLAEKCGRRNCVNPEHLEPTTGGDNVTRGWAAKRSKKTQCANLHDLSTAGINKQGKCKQCAKDAQLKWRSTNLEHARKLGKNYETGRRARNKDEINARRRKS